ncbi:hypothetical protein F6V30_13595 [Oryzomonas sagensis]|uniref:Uncharacterized protein n=1 Tax=Oryzomonas sagensis TaxID=2603857 RepID=A0ABQ6TMX7_9BACT|nr:hypothetical protein [Oryzomonas sagensis]KAB0669822.1 hypothetical protein F6V30_13595 [Oryzomonas sagensis]
MIERRRPSVGTIGVLAALILLSSAGVHAEENVCGPTTPSEEHLFNLQLENEGLKLRIKQLETVKTISAERLRQKKVQRLREIAAEVKTQRQTTSDFQGFVKWMSTNLAGYNRYIQAGSYAAVAARMLPIPYAGQASIFTKFVTQFTVALNNASVSVTNYLNSSQRFIALVEVIDPAKPLDEKAITEASHFADQKLLKDMNDAQTKLATVADLSSGALSFLESVNHYASGTDEYWNKVKGLMKKDVDPKEKSFLSESTSNLKTQANRFNGKLRSFEEITKKEAASVKSLAVYDELAADLVAAK